MLIVVIPFVVQDEPLVGTTAFWFTRPISRLTLLKSKILFTALILVAPPLIAQVAVLSANGVTLHDIALAVPEIVISQLCWILALATLAVITPNFGRFAIAGAVLAVIVVLVMIAVQWARMFMNPESLVFQMQDYSLMKSRSFAGTIVAILAGGTIVIHQYLTRRTARSIIAAGLGFAAVIAVQNLLPWNFFRPVPVKHGDTTFDSAPLKIALGSRVTMSDVMTARGQGPAEKDLQAQIDTLGAPAGYVIEPQKVHPSFKTADGQAVTVERVGFTGFRSAGDDTNAMEAALGGTPIVNAGSSRNYRPPMSLGVISADTSNKYRNQPLVFSADIDFLASKYVVVAEMPLVKGSRFNRGSVHVAMTDVLKQPGGVDILLRVRKVQLLFDRGTDSDPRLAGGEKNVVYLLRNKNRNEAMMQKQSNSFNVTINQSILSNQPVRLSYGPDPNRSEYIPDITDQWLADAELVRLELVPVEEYSKHLTVDRFLMNGAGESYFDTQVRSDLMELQKITLPDNPTGEQVKDYIAAIMVASRKQTSFGDNDPQVAMLKKVGSENLDALLEYESRLGQGGQKMYITDAVLHLARPEDKALVLRALPNDHELAELVVKYGWQADARDTLISGLDQEKQYLPQDWIKAVASFQDPSTYPALTAYLVNGNAKQDTFDAIKQLPGIDLSDAVDQIWKKARYSNTYGKLQVCAIAAECGHMDALETAVEILKKEENEYELKQAAKVITKFTPATGDYAALIAWFEANKAKLIFDPQSKTFIPAK